MTTNEVEELKKKTVSTDLFRQSIFLITDRNKKNLSEIKNKLSLLTNLKMDDSTFLRGVIEYFSKNEEELQKLKGYLVKNKSTVLFKELFDLMNQEATDEEIYEKIGLDKKTLNKIKTKN